eukprot:32044-Prymnesium_polylepis.2
MQLHWRSNRHKPLQNHRAHQAAAVNVALLLCAVGRNKDPTACALKEAGVLTAEPHRMRHTQSSACFSLRRTCVTKRGGRELGEIGDAACRFKLTRRAVEGDGAQHGRRSPHIGARRLDDHLRAAHATSEARERFNAAAIARHRVYGPRSDQESSIATKDTGIGQDGSPIGSCAATCGSGRGSER